MRLSAKVLRYQPGERLARHYHSQASLSLMLQGEQNESIGPDRFHCRTHSTMLKGPGIEHANHVGPAGALGLFVEMSDDAEAELRDAGARPLGVSCFADYSTSHLVRRIGAELRLQRAGADLIVEGLLYELLGTLVRKRELERQSPGDVRLRRALEFLEANYRTQTTVADVAEACDIHPSYLAELFRSRQGTSVGEWIRNRRLEFARDALRNPDVPLSRIACQAGFADQSHLTRLFRARFGVTPGEYRRTLS